MSVIATLNVGANGATTLAGSSAGISTAADRERFLKLHRRASVHVAGTNSAASEHYSSTNIPLVILSRSTQSKIAHGREIINTTDGLQSAMHGIKARFPAPIVVEAGPTLLKTLIEQGCIEEIELSISPLLGDGNFIDYDELLTHFNLTEDQIIDGTRLLHGRYNGDSAYR
jgi:riboflavin biosynthesis pyrimidine reductase